MTEAIAAASVLAQRVNRGPRRVLDSTVPPDVSDRSLTAVAIAMRWWSGRAAEVGLSGWCADAVAALPAVPGFDPAVLRAADDIGARAVASSGWRPPLDREPHELAEAYVTGLDERVRAAGGRHYTPPALAEQVWDQTVAVPGDTPGQLVCDPACGTGALLAPALRQWLARYHDTSADFILSNAAGVVRGYDLDPVAVWLGNLLLNAQLLPFWARVPATRRQQLPQLLLVGDGLRDPMPTSAGAVVMNPPYGRVRLSNEDRLRWEHTLFGHANRYGLFMAAGMEQVIESGGVLTALVPAGWLGGSYFQRLRSYLSKAAALEQVSYLGDRSGVFATGVLQETVVATFRRGGNQAGVACERLVTDGGRCQVTAVGVGQLPADARQPWLLPRLRGDVTLVEAATHMPARLGTYGWTVSTGPLVWNRHKDQITRDQRDGAVGIVWAADIDGGVVHQDPKRDQQRYVRIRSAREGAIWVLARPAVLVQRTTAPEQPQRIVAAELGRDTLECWGGKVVVENHVNVLTCSDDQSPLSTRLLVALLCSRAVDRLYRCLTGSVAVSAYELSSLPLPDRETLVRWAALDDESIVAAIRLAYGENHVESEPDFGSTRAVA